MSTHEIQIPKLGMDTTDCEVIAWLVKVGDRVEKGAELLEVETEKANVAIEAPVTGVVTEIRAQAGDSVEVGASVGTIEA
jgi:pyruvate/2-oxoglutarate dehydrogenase complex dihydrolipoamide acyltransferase (E2) component